MTELKLTLFPIHPGNNLEEQQVVQQKKILNWTQSQTRRQNQDQDQDQILEKISIGLEINQEPSC